MMQRSLTKRSSGQQLTSKMPVLMALTVSRTVHSPSFGRVLGRTPTDQKKYPQHHYSGASSKTTAY